MAAKKNKLSDEQQVQDYLSQLEHPLLEEIKTLHLVIKQTDERLRERIKWNAPSYYTSADLFTFNFHDKKVIRLIFHHPAVVQIPSPLLQGNYPDRRIAYFENEAQIREQQAELVRVIRELIALAG